MLYCGVALGPDFQHLCALEEVRTPEPPVRLAATFYEPGTVEQVAAEIRRVGQAVIGLAGPLSKPREGRQARACDEELRHRGVAPAARGLAGPGRRLRAQLEGLRVYSPAVEDQDGVDSTLSGVVADGAYEEAPLFETNADGVFCALQGRRIPARRHPLGVQRRIEELEDDHVEDPGGDLWHRRIDELDAAAAALAAHRYAVGHACWTGDPAEGVIVLPGSSLPDRFTPEGVIPPVARAPLPAAGGSYT